MDGLPPPEDFNVERGYVIGPLDRLVVDVHGFPELTNRRLQVDSAGNIFLSLTGELRVGGKTPAEAAQFISDRLRLAHVRNARAAVNVEEPLSRLVTIDGQVLQPGNYPVLNEMTLMRSIASAKGVSEFARLEDVVVFRTVGSQRMAALYNLSAIRRGLYEDPGIFAGDVIVVGDSPARRLFRDFIAITPLLASPLVALLNNP